MTVVVATEDRLPTDLSGIDCWLHAGPSADWRLRAGSGPLIGLPRLDRADRLQEIAWELRKPFLEWVGKLGALHDSAEWWSSQLASRTSYNGLYERVCLLAVTLETLRELREESILIVCSTPALAQEVARAAAVQAPPIAATRRAGGSRALRAWARLAPPPLLPVPGRAFPAIRRTLDTDPRYRRRVLAHHGLLEHVPLAGPDTALLFTWIDERSFDDEGNYRDPHLGALADMLRERGLEVALLARVLHTLSFDQAAARLAATGERFLFPDAYLELSDHRDCAASAAAFDPRIPDDAAVAGVPVARLARELVARERPGQAGALATGHLMRRLVDAGVRPGRIVHTCEGHPWELVLAHTARRLLPQTTVIGYENLYMSRLSLSMFSAPVELSIRPLPDRIVTNGPAFRDVLVADGLPEHVVRVGCALRHRSLWKSQPGSSREPREHRSLRVVVAGEIALSPSVELVLKSAEAFDGDPAYELLVKPHPLQPRRELERVLGERAHPLRFVEEPTSVLLASADLLLYMFSAVGFEALAVGVPPVFVRSDSALDLDKLEFARALRWEARTPEELREVALQIAALSDSELRRWREAAREAALQALAPCDPASVAAFL